MLILYFLLGWAHEIYLFLGDGFMTHYIILCVGVLAGIILYYTRLRWMIVMGILLLILQVILSFLEDFISAKDIDYYFILHGIKLKVFLAFIASLLSYCLLNNRLTNIFSSSLLSIMMVYFIAQSKMIYQLSLGNYIESVFVIIPIVVLYFLYVQNKHMHVYKIDQYQKNRVLLQSLGFLILLVFVSFGIYYYMNDELDDMRKKLSKEFVPDQAESLEERTSEGVKVKNESKLSGRNNRTNELLMVAYIDNFIDGTDVPNPLYLTSFYYTYFDSLTETFKRVDDMPDKDLFSPDPSNIALYFTETDSSVLNMVVGNKMMKTVEVEVYNKGLETSMFFAPSTSFSIQPIAVDKNFQTEYKNAYKSKSLVSELNSAYFVYNSQEPEVIEYQNRRIEMLRSVKYFNSIDSRILKYYTELPSINYIKDIQTLTNEITQNALTPIDKIVAIRDYFQSKDELGHPLFKYSDNPGIPDLPSAYKLHYFLFENRAGYCAYYAGATLLMLRSIGIPSRISVGFLTHDRSTVNKGWYYFYANQLHAWVQVYFPGYGWIDFDTTIGNTEAQESPQPDGTPPSAPQKAAISILGTVMDVDTLAQTMTVVTNQMVFNDSSYLPKDTEIIKVDLGHAELYLNNKLVSTNSISIYDTAAVLVFNQQYAKGINSDNIAEKVVSADRVQIKPFKSANNDSQDGINKNQQTKSNLIVKIIILSIFLIIVLFMFPRIVLKNYLKKAKNIDPKIAYQNAYQALTLFLHQHEIVHSYKMTPTELFSTLDDQYGTNLAQFYKAYQKVKLSNHQDVVMDYNISRTIDAIKRKHYAQQSWITKSINEVNFIRTIEYLLNHKK